MRIPRCRAANRAHSASSARGLDIGHLA
jgi:hypothetical protein